MSIRFGFSSLGEETIRETPGGAANGAPWIAAGAAGKPICRADQVTLITAIA
jgi:hypothetical protein